MRKHKKASEYGITCFFCKKEKQLTRHHITKRGKNTGKILPACEDCHDILNEMEIHSGFIEDDIWLISLLPGNRYSSDTKNLVNGYGRRRGMRGIPKR